MTILAFRRFAALSLCSLILAACGSSGGTDNPSPPPAPVAPPPPPEPTFAERLQEWADMDPNPCRARTPGFEALGGWLKDDGRDVGESRVWVSDSGALREEDGSWADTHGARIWQTFIDCAVRSDETQYNYFLVEERRAARNFVKLIREDGGDFILSQSTGGIKETPKPGVWWDREADTGAFHNVDCGHGPGSGDCRAIDRVHDGENGSGINGQRVLWVRPAGNDDGEVTNHAYNGGIRLALEEWRTSLVIITGGYSGTPENADPTTGSSICGETEALCLFARYDSPIGRGTSHSTADGVGCAGHRMGCLAGHGHSRFAQPRFRLFAEPGSQGRRVVNRAYLRVFERALVHIEHQSDLGPWRVFAHLPVHAERRAAGPHDRQPDLRGHLRSRGRADHRGFDYGNRLHGSRFRTRVRTSRGSVRITRSPLQRI